MDGHVPGEVLLCGPQRFEHVEHAGMMVKQVSGERGPAAHVGQDDQFHLRADVARRVCENAVDRTINFEIW